VAVSERVELTFCAIHPGVGDAYANALMECVIGLFKTGCIQIPRFHRGPYRTIADVEYATAGWVHRYNHRRLHSTLEMVPPAESQHHGARRLLRR